MSGAATNVRRKHISGRLTQQQAHKQSKQVIQWNTKACKKCYLLFPRGNKPVRNDESGCKAVVECYAAPGFVVRAPLLTAAHIGKVQFHGNGKEKIEGRIN